VGTGRGAEQGVLVRDAEALELLQQADTLVVDKTGTLTEGKPRVVNVEAANGFSEEEVLRLAASLERGSEHPLAGAVVAAAMGRGIHLTPATDFQSVTGKGVTGTIEGRSVLLGSPSFLAERGVEAAAGKERAEQFRLQGQTVVLVAVDGRWAGLLG